MSLRVAVVTTDVSEVELAAVTTAVLALASTGSTTPATGVPAWQQAALREGAGQVFGFSRSRSTSVSPASIAASASSSEA